MPSTLSDLWELFLVEFTFHAREIVSLILHIDYIPELLMLRLNDILKFVRLSLN